MWGHNKMIQISQTAAKKIRSLKSEENQPDSAFLRIDVKKGGCSGMSYKMNFETEVKETDKAFDAFGERVVVDNNSYLYLIGLTLDFSGGLNGKGFVFSNPNAKKTCGCGISFNV